MIGSRGYPLCLLANDAVEDDHEHCFEGSNPGDANLGLVISLLDIIGSTSRAVLIRHRCFVSDPGRHERLSHVSIKFFRV